MKKWLSLVLAVLLAMALILNASAGCSNEDHNTVKFDFNSDDGGFVPIFSDYPNQKAVEEFYEFQHIHQEIPIQDAGKGLFISGNNHSDDLFMGYVKNLNGFTPGQTYHFSVKFRLATNVEGGLIGVGGSPGESVVVKCGITAVEPRSAVTQEGSEEFFRMNIDTGTQVNGGKDREAPPAFAGSQCWTVLLLVVQT